MCSDDLRSARANEYAHVTRTTASCLYAQLEAPPPFLLVFAPVCIHRVHRSTPHTVYTHKYQPLYSGPLHFLASRSCCLLSSLSTCHLPPPAASYSRYRRRSFNILARRNFFLFTLDPHPHPAPCCPRAMMQMVGSSVSGPIDHGTFIRPSAGHRRRFALLCQGQCVP